MGIGLLLGLEGLFMLIFGGKELYIKNPSPGVFSIGGVQISQARMLIFSISVVLIIIVFFFLNRTKLGNAMRAVAQDPEAAALQGINVNFIRQIGFAIASALAGIAGGLMLTITFVSPWIGSPMAVTGFLIMIIGGMGNLTGAVIGAIALGIIDSFGFTFIGARAVLLSYGLVIIILMFRPKGLLGGTY
jgi:branched-chain amino acid transport system permease protein